MNSVNIIGNLTRDPEARYTSGGDPIITFGIAWNGRKKQNGEWVDQPHFFNVTAFGERFEKVASFLSKGSKVGVSGRLNFSSWVDQQTGAKRTNVDIIANEITFASAKGEGGGNGGGRTPADDDIPASAFGGTAAADDDIPF